MANNFTTSDVNVSEKPGWVNEFLWSCAGVNKAVLRQCPTDYSKYAGIGGMILFTAIMAAISGGYALYFVFNSYEIAGLFGIFWGLLIFNLDRFIVNTMYSDGKHTISWGEIKSGLPRIIMAIFLGLVISTPLEMKIFSDQIDTQVKIDNGRREDQRRKSNHQIYDDLDKLEAQRQSLLDSKQALENSLEVAQQKHDEEISGEHRGVGPIAKELKIHITEAKDAIARWEATNSSNLERINNDIVRQKARIQEFEEQMQKDSKLNGFAIRYEAFENVTNRSEHFDLWLVSLMITLLFVIIETAPTFLKMMMEDGPYDDLLRAQKHKTKVLADKSISDVNDAVNTCVRISTMKNEKRLVAENIANEEIMTTIARAQAELLETAIAGWKEIELEKIRQNPYAYVVSLVPPKQELEVTSDAEGILSEFIHNDVCEMEGASNDIIENSGDVNQSLTPEDIIDEANEAPETISPIIEETDLDTNNNRYQS